ncbi:hypothetical protein HPT27_02875 [Permianibacter sp. IMCC34836]|uniref:pre-peptidase C-terminal domain-containing protein n=1 Tax=Permianibacter fluminis TaxID=2738515 RepID=UPI001553BA3C|nr:pre-peptidase C-terminal domain-containing protein [Permianibacter fluminis]NQD35950.1 hypothetical protein [Permianibacter fluminis]
MHHAFRARTLPHFKPLALAVAAFAGTALAAPATFHDDGRSAVKLDLVNAKSAPLDYLRANAARYQLPKQLNNLQLVKVQESLTGKHYHYQQMQAGYPVDKAEVVVSVGNNGAVYQVYNNSFPVPATLAAAKTAPVAKLSREAALDRAWANQKVRHGLTDQPTASLVWVPVDGQLKLSWKVHVAAQMPTGAWLQYLDADSGNLLKSEATTLVRKGERALVLGGDDRAATSEPLLDRKAAMQEFTRKQAISAKNDFSKTSAIARASALASGINGSGNVFDPDPRTTLNNDSLSDTTAAASFDAAYQNKALLDLTVSNGVYSLSGPWVNIKNIEAPNTAPSTTTTGIWTAKRGNNAFNDSNTYFHLDQNQRYMQSLGFTGSKGIIARPLDVDTDGLNGDDNSHYSFSGSTDYLAFGHGCVDDNEDADVILHEYGHAIQHNINSNWSGGDTGAMGEGFGDYWAGSYSYSTPNGASYHPEWAFSWDGHNNCWGGRVMNKTTALYNSSKTYGAHQSVTEGGVTFQSDELWSTPLFQALVELMAQGKPRANVDKIILEAHFGLGANLKMPDMANATVAAATALFPSDPTYANVFKAKFVAQKILSDTTTPPPSGNMNETESNNSFSTANSVATSGTVVAGNMASSSDGDYFKVTLPAGKTLTATLTPNASSDYDLYVYNSSQKQVASSTNGTGQVDTASSKNTATSSKTYYVRVKYYSGGTGASNGTYTLKLSW